jgi:menaquinone-dependent protoporphyrinogen oxidase
MKVLVAYASKAGSTKGIAEYIGEKLRARGLSAEVEDVSSVKSVGEYDAFVVGSAVYMFHWTKEAKQFVLKNQAHLASRPVWLFSSGPVGNQKTNSEGRDLLDVSVSGPKEIEELTAAAKPRSHRVFFGALDGSKLGGAMGLTYRFMRRSKAIRESMPDGDYRDWKDIEAWANGIAEELSATVTTMRPGQ